MIKLPTFLLNLFHVLADDWKNKTLLTMGFSFAYISRILHKMNNQTLHDFTDVCEAFLKITSLISFFIYVIINWRPVKKELKKFFSKKAS